MLRLKKYQRLETNLAQGILRQTESNLKQDRHSINQVHDEGTNMTSL